MPAIDLINTERNHAC